MSSMSLCLYLFHGTICDMLQREDESDKRAFSLSHCVLKCFSIHFCNWCAYNLLYILKTYLSIVCTTPGPKTHYPPVNHHASHLEKCPISIS